MEVKYNYQITIREIQSILAQRGFGVGFVGEKFTLLEKTSFIRKRWKTRGKNKLYGTIESIKHTDT